ncbi:MAG TPA: signal recognition particle-docking protein FtsY [Nitrospiria bacterium]|nr:signal recognition particle-docking protein FtsY [Nitrospiria bacterium]
MSLWNRIVSGLAKSRDALATGFQSLLGGSSSASAVSFEDLEAAMIQADIGIRTTERLLGEVKRAGDVEPDAIKRRLQSLIAASLQPTVASNGQMPEARPTVVLMVGVNGVGKTTTVAKLAARARAEGRSVMLAACDTFRAAAIDQLRIWGERLGVEVVHQQPGSDPAAVAFDAVSAAKARGIDVVYVDSAGRLHTKHSLMDELTKVKRVIAKALPGAPHEVLLVLDATVGQNGLAQARAFHAALGLTGIVVTKVDGSSKGGIVLAVVEELGVPVKWLGLGESADALVPFDAEAFAYGLVGATS